MTAADRDQADSRMVGFLAFWEHGLNG